MSITTPRRYLCRRRGTGMDSRDLTPDQAQPLAEQVQRHLAYLHALRSRMDRRASPATIRCGSLSTGPTMRCTGCRWSCTTCRTAAAFGNNLGSPLNAVWIWLRLSRSRETGTPPCWWRQRYSYALIAVAGVHLALTPLLAKWADCSRNGELAVGVILVKSRQRVHAKQRSPICGWRT